MIRLFSSIETDFTHNGVQVLDDIVYGDTCILTNEINNVYALEMELSIFDNDKWRDIEAEMFLKVPTSKGDQLFRIKEVVKGLNSLKVFGKHVFFDLENNFIMDTNVVEKDGVSALNQILGAKTNNMVNTYYCSSDISTIANSRLVRKNIVTALLSSDDNSFINRWGGELEVNNFNFAINERIGENRGFQIRYAKNCTGFEGKINTYNMCTRIVPIGYDGIMRESPSYIDSPFIAAYPQIYTYEIKFDYVKVDPEDPEAFATLEDAQAELESAALTYFDNTKCDLPTFSATVNFETLQYTEEYKDLQLLERVELGDDVQVYLSNIDINVTARVVKTKYNFFTKKYTELNIGEASPNVFKQLIDLKNNIDIITDQLGGNSWQDLLDKALDEATKLMEEGLTDSYVITMRNQIVIGDDPDINNMVNCIVINKNGIGFSNNGYLPEQLISAMTIDGKINASCINVGQLNAALIKVGTIQSINSKVAIGIDDDTGITITGGAFTLKNNNNTVVIDGQHNIHKIIAEGTTTINYVDESITVTVAHNLGYKPAFSAYQMGANGANEFTQLPAMTWSNGVIAMIRARCDNTNLYFDFLTSTGYTETNLTIYIKYFLYLEVCF